MPSRRLALLIGASEFDDPGLARLLTPRGDTDALRTVLADPKIGRFTVLPPVWNVSEAEIRRQIDRFFSSAQAQDLLLVYYSGHGLLDERGRLYLAAKDTARDALASTAIAASFISDIMDRTISQAQVLVLDCCHSGAFAKGAKAALAASVGTSVAFRGSTRGRAILTATDNTEYAWSGDEVLGQGGQSTFTRHLVTGLKTGKADLNHDGLITLDDLYGYVRDRVGKESARQTPQLFKIRQSGDVVIGWTKKSARAERAGPVPAMPLEAAPKVEVISVPKEIRAGEPGEFRLRFGPAVTSVRVVFGGFDQERLEVKGRDKRDGEFHHDFIEGGSREITYQLTAKDTTTDRPEEEVKVLVYEGEDEVFARAYPISIKRASWWHGFKAQMNPGLWFGLVSLLITLITFVVTFPPWRKISELFQGPPFSSYTANFTNDEVVRAYWDFAGKGEHATANWPLTDTWGALHLKGDNRALMLPSAFGPGNWAGRRPVLQDCSLTVDFQIVGGDNIGFLMHALRDSQGRWRQGYLFKLLWNSNYPTLKGDSRKYAFLRLEAYQLPNGDRLSFRSVETRDAPAFRVRIGRDDWYSLECRHVGGQFEFSITPFFRDIRSRNGSGEKGQFAPFTLKNLEGGTAGIDVRGTETEVYLHRWTLESLAPTPPADPPVGGGTPSRK
jgi:hypothetical protein